jgi:hypothetical protein
MTPSNDIRVFQFFRTGRHITSDGRATEWTESTLDQICENYRFQEKAPLVLGHPADSTPVFGKVKEIFKRNGALYAVANCSKALIDLVRSGVYKHVSASFEAFNPRTGWTLRHIGFLGAMAPSVKGLAPLEFGEPVHGPVCFSEFEGLPIGCDFTPPSGYRADPSRLPLYQAAQAIRAGCPALSFAEAARLAEKLS